MTFLIVVANSWCEECLPGGGTTARWLGCSPRCEAEFGAEMLEDNLASRLPASGSKRFIHPEMQKVNIPSLCFTQKTIMKIMFVLNGVWWVSGRQQALDQQLD